METRLFFICSVVSTSSWPHELHHTVLPCLSLSPGVCSNSSPLSQWCYLTISSSGAPFFSCPQCFPASGSFPVSQLFTSGGQSIGASALVLPMNSQGWFPLGLTDLISFLSKGPSRVFSSTAIFSTQKVLFCLAALAGGPVIPFLSRKRFNYFHL